MLPVTVTLPSGMEDSSQQSIAGMTGIMILVKNSIFALNEYTLRNKSLNEFGYFPSNGFPWKAYIELTFYHINSL